MRSVFKYPLDVVDEQIVVMPHGAEVLAVNRQGDTICVWAIVDEDAAEEEYHFSIRGTGHPLPGPATKATHVGTVFQGPFVWHVFLVTPI